MNDLINVENKEQEISSENSSEKNYLQELFDRLKNLNENDKTVSFIIQEPRKKGFLIKVGGLYGNIEFRLFPIHYRIPEIWKIVSPLLIGQKFYGKIKTIKDNPIHIEMFGKVHLFEKLELELEKPYKAIVVHKKRFGMNIELGSYYGWKYGSILGFVHKLSFKEESDFEKLNVGDEITTYFQKQTFDQDPVFGELTEEFSKDLSHLESLIGTTQNVRLRIDENGKKHYGFDKNFYGNITITELLYGSKNRRNKVRDFLKSLETGNELLCEVIGIVPKKRKFLFKVIDQRINELD